MLPPARETTPGHFAGGEGNDGGHHFVVNMDAPRGVGIFLDADGGLEFVLIFVFLHGE